MQANPNLEVRLEEAFDAEPDGQWLYVDCKSNQRWLWFAVDHATNTVLAYVFGKRKDDVFKQLKALLEPFGIPRHFTDGWVRMNVTSTLKNTKQANETPKKW